MSKPKPKWLSLTYKEYTETDNILNTCLPKAKIQIFGSRVGNGSHRQQADLDLLIDNGAPIEMSKLSELKNMLSESNLSIRIDILDRYEASESFLALIENDEFLWPKD